MSIGLVALLDDVAALAKVAAASVDDIAGQAAKAGIKAAGVVIDDAAVTPRYVVGFAAERELPIVWKIAVGSLKNKLIILLPAALLLGYFAPWIITPLLMLGGAYLCYEGAEKVLEMVLPHHAHSHEAAVGAETADPKVLEDARVAGAIKTDFILSAEIMALTLASVTASSLTGQAAVLAVVGLGITAIVYGGVALIVKADDVGVALARRDNGMVRAIGFGLVRGMPVFLKVLALVGTAAMIWVGGGIIIHGLETFGLDSLAHAVHDAALAVSAMAPTAHGFVEWLVSAAASGVFGLVIGGLIIPVIQFGVAPLVKAIRGKDKPVVS